MKRSLTTLMLLVFSCILYAQNIQLHYDFGKHISTEAEGDRQPVTLTYELFKADRWGSWFYFVDLDLSDDLFYGAYTEISREFNLGKSSPFAAHVEYDGGIGLNGSFQHALLLGPAWNGHNADYSATYSIQLMYKQYLHSYKTTHSYASAQLTGVWGLQFLDKKMSFSGFIDFWRGEKPNRHGQLVILAEPQLWYNLNTLPRMKDVNLSVGTEVEVSNNFIYNTANSKTFFVNPTLALKWTF